MRCEELLIYRLLISNSYASQVVELTEPDIEIYEYDIGLPPVLMGNERYNVAAGKNTIDLGGFNGIVSCKVNGSEFNAHIILGSWIRKV